MSDVLPVKMSQMKDSGETFFIELYIINLRSGTSYIAATDEDIVFNGQKYVAVPFQRQNITRSMDNITDSCQVSLSDVSYELLAYVMEGFDFRGSSCTVLRIMYPDSIKDPTICQWVFSGYIDEPSYSDGIFTCKIMSRFPSIECPNRAYHLACNSEFGDEQCKIKVVKENVGIKSVQGSTLTLVKAYPTGYWKDGVAFVEGESRIIESSIDDTITLNVNFLQDLRGKSVELSQGCNKTHEACKGYGNTKNYSGFPAIPFETMYR